MSNGRAKEPQVGIQTHDRILTRHHPFDVLAGTDCTAREQMGVGLSGLFETCGLFAWAISYWVFCMGCASTRGHFDTIWPVIGAVMLGIQVIINDGILWNLSISSFPVNS